MRDDAAERDRRIASKVEGILTAASARRRDAIPDLPEIVAKLQTAYDVALACHPPQVNAAVSAVSAMGRLLGYDISRSVVAVGTPQDYLHGETSEEPRATHS